MGVAIVCSSSSSLSLRDIKIFLSIGQATYVITKKGYLEMDKGKDSGVVVSLSLGRISERTIGKEKIKLLGGNVLRIIEGGEPFLIRNFFARGCLL